MFVCIIAFQLMVAMISIDLLAAVRAYVTGESLYSKGQKDAQIHLLDYAENHREEDYQRFQQALAVPLADRAAREELQKPDPDPAVARGAFLGGGNHPDDVDGLIRLFRWFHNVSFMAEAIQTWTEGDLVIEQTRILVERAHERVVAGDFGAAAVGEMRQQAPILNRRLSTLERKFSAQLGDASRRTQRLLLGLNLALAVLLGLTGLAFVRHSWRVQALTEEEVRQRQESLQRLLDSAAEGLYGVDTHGRCTFINRAALTMLGYAHESDLLGRDIHALIHHSHADGSRYSDRESSLYRACRERRELHVEDEVLWRRDGTPIAVEYWSHPVLHDGDIHGAVVTFFDIGKRLSMQKALRERELGMARLVDAVMDGVITIDENQRVILFNRAAEQVFGVSAGEAIGALVDRFILRLRIEQAASDDSDGRSKSLLRELTGVRADGTEFPLEASLSRLQTESGIFVTVVLRDVSELVQARAERQARAALEAANRAKTDFLSRMSHELRTPLNAVLGFSQLLRLDAVQPPTPRQLERIVRVENAGVHLLALVNDVLDLSRVDSGQMTLLLESVNLQRVVDDAVAMVSPLAAAAGIQLLVTGEPGRSDIAMGAGNACILADRVRLRQVLVNLLSNAVKYNRAGGHVTVSWASLAGICHLRITDTGPGMTPENLAHLFEPFNRLGAEKTAVDGTGIGLVLSRRLVEMMGGVLQIDSEVGRGTVATLLLESSDKAAAGEPVGVPPSQHGALEGHLSVLYAEDNEVNVELVRQILGFRPAFSLRVAENGATALAMAQEYPPDVLLLDMNLGDMTGMKLASALRRDPATRAIRLVALSADALPEQIATALASGFETYLTKPIDFRKLLNVLDACAQRSTSPQGA